MILVTLPDLPADYQASLLDRYGDIYFLVDFLNGHIPLEKIEILITYGFDLDECTLNKLPSLKWVQVFQTGVEHIQLNELENRDILLTNVRGIYGNSISEYVMSFILYFMRDMERFIENQRLQIYNRSILPDEVYGKTIVILGAGAIGREIAKKAKLFQMKVIGVNTTGSPVEGFDEMYTFDDRNQVMGKGDFVVALFPVTDKTYHCITKEQFQLMKKSAYFINVGRADLIVEEDLIQALQQEMIKGAVLDVFNEEPLPKSSPLWEVDTLYLTPHISGKTKLFYQRCIDIFDENYRAFKAGDQLAFNFNYQKGY
ncbi:D-2-hydroxyacid dehydrogenase [Niallia nealsonii]|uniref:D-2-hydroxyacid dehydrogenase n=1 Tax=Niallia nealsonii TaxID=115979 RepID=UPI0012FEC6D1|nr:D-2-hydroxyacid dehydrogenase [Niallia nealsonii]